MVWRIPRCLGLGSPGEHFRNLQLVVQLPRQDLSADNCRHLKQQANMSAFEEFWHIAREQNGRCFCTAMQEC